MRTIRIKIPEDRGVLYEVIKYPAGEIQTRLTHRGLALLTAPRVEGFEIQANPIPDIIELAQLTDAVRRSGTFFTRRLFLPYLPFARADRRFVDGDCVGFMVYKELIDAMGFTSKRTFDAHNAVLAKAWGWANMLPTDDVVDQIAPIIKRLGKKGLVFILPDKGAALRYHDSLKKYKVPILVADKVRDPKTGALKGFKIGSGIKAYTAALIIDDICDGGGTFIGQAEAIHKKNPGCQVSLYVSHGIFSKGLDVLYDGGITEIFCSDYSFKSNVEGFKEVKV